MRRAIVIICALALGACSDDSSSGDGSSRGDGGSGLPDGYGKLFPCDEPQAECNAHNSCAIAPVCSADKLCIPASVQDCSDDLECTKDTCAGTGLCKNTPKSGTCALVVKPKSATDGGGGARRATEVRCFTKGQLNPNDPCEVCDPEVGDGGSGAGPTRWSPRSGGTCNDGNSCTRDDYCQQGVCKGTDYSSKCDDKLSCTTDRCDGKGGCLDHVIDKDFCVIDKVCYKKGTKDSIGCASCDPKKSQKAWTPTPNVCKIDKKCYQADAKHPEGCAACKPAKSATAWTLTSTSHCLIDGACYQDKAKFGCLVCDVSKSRTAWTKPSGCTYLTLDVGKHSTTYSYATDTRGYWFTAPSSFTIIGLRAPTDLGTEVQNVQVIKLNAAPSLLGTTSYTTLFYKAGVSGTGFIPCSVKVQSGDIIGIFGTRGTTTMKNSYGATYTYSTKINGKSVTLTRLTATGNLNKAKITGYVSGDSLYYYARVEMRYQP